MHGVAEPSAINNFTADTTRTNDGDDGIGVTSYKVTMSVESTGFVGSAHDQALQVNNAGATPWSVLPKYGGGRIPGNHPSNDPALDMKADAADAGYATLDWSTLGQAMFGQTTADGESLNIVQRSIIREYSKTQNPLTMVQCYQSLLCLC